MRKRLEITLLYYYESPDTIVPVVCDGALTTCTCPCRQVPYHTLKCVIHTHQARYSFENRTAIRYISNP